MHEIKNNLALLLISGGVDQECITYSEPDALYNDGLLDPKKILSSQSKQTDFLSKWISYSS